MKKNINAQQDQHSETTANHPSAGKKREEPLKKPRIPLPNKPTTPAKPDENPDPTIPKPDINEPKKNDPTRIDEPPQIFNTI